MFFAGGYRLLIIFYELVEISTHQFMFEMPVIAQNNWQAIFSILPNQSRHPDSVLEQHRVHWKKFCIVSYPHSK
jgi:hypothetical protein